MHDYNLWKKWRFSGVVFIASSCLAFNAVAQQRVVDLKEIIVDQNKFETVKFEATPTVRPAITTQTLPAVKNLRLFELKEQLNKTINAVTLIEFDRKSKHEILENGEFVSAIDRQKVVFNDRGELPDIEPGDGVFSAFSSVDFERLEKDESIFNKRLSKQEKLVLKTFNGRVATSSVATSLDSLLEAQGKRLSEDSMMNARELDFGKGLVGIARPALSIVLPAIPFTADENKVLGINSTSVVAHPGFTYDPCDTDGTGNNANPNNAWSFKTLMSNLNQGTGLTDQEFIHEWLSNWMVNSSVNSFVIPARPGIMDYFIGWDGVNAATLDINNLPFRLLSIMNRLDLAKVSYLSATEGETRFVFGLLNPLSCGPATGIDQMTAIFEYGDTANTCSTIKTRAQDWLALDTMVLGSPAYMNALKAITDDVTLSPIASATLNQLRSNDFAFDGIGSLGLPWQLREFIVSAGTGLLVPDTTKQTPDISFRTGNPVTALFMETNADDILCENYQVPNNFNGSPFLAAGLDYISASFWNAPTSQANLPAAYPSCYQSTISGVHGSVNLPTELQSEVRHKFSVNTCDDCHAQETDTFFTHVNPVTRNFSGFMTGNTVGDPMLGNVLAGGIERDFDDLQRRGQIVQELATRQCNGGLILNASILQNALPSMFTH